MTTTAVAKTALRCPGCGQCRPWCSCRTEPAQTYILRGRYEIGILIWCRHTPERGEMRARYPATCGLTTRQMIVETAKASPEPWCDCVKLLIEGEQER